MRDARDWRCGDVSNTLRRFDPQLRLPTGHQRCRVANKCFDCRRTQHTAFHDAVHLHRIDNKELVQAMPCMDPQDVGYTDVTPDICSFNFVIRSEEHTSELQSPC